MSANKRVGGVKMIDAMPAETGQASRARVTNVRHMSDDTRGSRSC
jgi:hypothetical protein